MCNGSTQVFVHIWHVVWHCCVSFTDSSKERARLRHTISEDRKKLYHLVMKYNKLIEVYGGSQLEPSNFDDTLRGIFPWSELSGTCVYVSKYSLLCYWIVQNRSPKCDTEEKAPSRFALQSQNSSRRGGNPTPTRNEEFFDILQETYDLRSCTRHTM